MILYSFKHFLQIREKIIVGNNLYGLKPIIEANDTTNYELEKNKLIH